MARYKGKKAIEGTVILIAIVAIVAVIILKFAIALALLLLPLFILIGFLYYFFLEKKNSDQIDNAKKNIWCSDDEINEQNKISKIISQASIKIEQANNKADVENISRKKDGSISLRSNLGKELASIVEGNSYVIRSKEDRYNFLCNLPIKRWEEYFSIYTRKIAFLYSLISYLICLPITTLVFTRSLSITSLKKVVFFPGKIFDSGALDTPEGSAMFLTLVLIVGSFFGGIIISSIKFKKEIKNPSIQSNANIA